MKRRKFQNLAPGIVFFTILSYPITAAAGSGIKKNDHIKLREIKRIKFSNLPEQIEFSNPSRIAINSKNELFVTDTRAHNIKIFDAEGQFLKVIGQEGKGPGDLNWPSGITYNGKYMIVWELGNYRFSLFNENGDFIRHYQPKQTAVVWKLKSLENGKVVFKIREGYCENEKSILYMLDMELDKGEIIYSHSIKRESYENKIKDDLKIPFGPLISWDVMKGNKIVIGYQEEYRIDIYEHNKKKLFTIEHQSKRIKVTDKDKEEYFSSLVYSTMGQTVQGALPEIRKYTKFPKFKPYYKNILVFPGNEIWVFLYTESKEKELVDIFDKEGIFIQRIECDKSVGYRPVIADDGTLWTIIEGEEGYNVVVNYRIEKN
ncbi:MAG: 6-bladed beta-propeller [Candidatus Aminicenantes bacterium]|nr:6-bladed beta-propeller [Candidatus Aminicenantes bacterium]